MLRLFLSLFLVLFPLISGAETLANPHKTQGFASYQESSEGTQFSCTKQCFIILDGMGKNDYLSLSGSVSGSGSIGYGFLNGQQIVPGEFRPVTSQIMMQERMMFSNNQYYSQIPKNLPIVLIVNGEIQSANLSIQEMEFSLSESMNENWTRFMKTENLAQYSINLLYGYSLGGISLTWILSLILFFIVIGIVFVYSFDHRRFLLPVALVSLFLVVGYDLREQINLYQIRVGYHDSYLSPTALAEKNWFGIGYYPLILEKASQYVTPTLTGQKIYLATMQSFPLFGYSAYGLYPAETVFVEDIKATALAKTGDIFIQYFSPLTVTDGWKMVYTSPDHGATLYIKQ